MKNTNTFYFVMTLFITLVSNAQIGIGNTSPKATLDVNKASYTVGEQAGIAVTQLTGAQIVAMTTSGLKAGTLVYATSTSGAIDSVGYWNWNGTAWKQVSYSTLYDTDGTLGSNRIVSQSDKTLQFTSNAITGTSHFSVDGSTFNINAALDRVGIGTNNPNRRLSIVDNGTSFEQLSITNSGSGGTVNDNAAITLQSTNRNTELDLVSGSANESRITFSRSDGATGAAIISNPSTFNIRTNSLAAANIALTIDNTQNIGIGTTTPSEKLHVQGNARVSSLAGTGSRMVVADTNGVLGTQPISSGASSLAITVPTTNDYTVLETDAVIYRTLTANGTITFPSTLPAGKVFYISNNSTSFDWNFSPSPINTGVAQVFAGFSHMIVTLGGGQILVVSGN